MTRPTLRDLSEKPATSRANSLSHLQGFGSVQTTRNKQRTVPCFHRTLVLKPVDLRVHKFFCRILSCQDTIYRQMDVVRRVWAGPLVPGNQRGTTGGAGNGAPVLVGACVVTGIANTDPGHFLPDQYPEKVNLERVSLFC